MLVSGGVKNDLGLEIGEDRTQPARIAHVGDLRLGVNADAAAKKLLLEFVDRIFVLVENRDSRRIEANQLADEFAADGAAGAGDENALAAIGGTDVGVQAGNFDAVAAEHVVDLSFAEAADGNLFVEDFAETGNDFSGKTGAAASRQNAGERVAARCRHADDDFFDSVFGGECGKFFPSAEDGSAGNCAADFLGIIVDETDDVVVAIGFELFGQQDSGAAGSV